MRDATAQDQSDVARTNPEAEVGAEASALFRLMADRIPGVLWAVDTELRFTASFGDALRQLNLLPNQVVGRTLYEYFETTDESLPVIAAHRRALDGETAELDIRWMRRLFQIRVEPLRDSRGRIVGCVGFARDATEHEQLIDALEKSERQYRLLAESTTDFVFIVDQQGTLQYANRSAAACFGVPPPALAGKSQTDLFPPELVQKHLQAIEQAFRTGLPYEEDEAIPFGSNWVWLNVRLLPLRDDHERITAVMGVCRDVSDRKRAEQIQRQSHDELERQVKIRTAFLRRSNEQLQYQVAERRQAENRLAMFQRLVEAAGQVFLLVELGGRITYVNAFGSELLGKTRAEIVGASLFDFYEGEDLGRLEREALPRVSEDGKWTGELSLLTAHGVLLKTLQHVFLVRDAETGSLGFATVITDITGLRAAQEALRHGEERYRTLVETCPDAVVMVDLNLQITFASSRAVELYGARDAAELCGQRIVNLMAEQERQRLSVNIPRLLQEGLRRNEEYMLRRTDGSEFAAEVSTAVVRDARGHPRALVAIVRDITERKLAREALHRERQNLWHMLRSSDHERQLIAYEIHDGLAQQLAGALLQFQSYEYQKDRHSDRARENFAAGLEALRQAHFEARRLISGVRPPILDEYGIDAALAHLANEKSLTAAARIEYESEVDFDRLAPILENTIYRIAQEALTNACQHSGGAEVRMSLVQLGDTVQLEVGDTGAGFDPETAVEHRFGLKGIKERTRMLGGQLIIDSAPQMGTTIRVVLPLLEQHESLTEGAP